MHIQSFDVSRKQVPGGPWVCEVNFLIKKHETNVTACLCKSEWYSLPFCMLLTYATDKT